MLTWETKVLMAYVECQFEHKQMFQGMTGRVSDVPEIFIKPVNKTLAGLNNVEEVTEREKDAIY